MNTSSSMNSIPKIGSCLFILSVLLSACGGGGGTSGNNTGGTTGNNTGGTTGGATGGTTAAPTATVAVFAGSGTAGAVDGTGTAASFKNPAGLAMDSAGNMYVADSGNKKIRKITSAGIVSSLAGSGSIGTANGTGAAASFFGLLGVVVDSAGNVFVADTANNLIRKITPAADVTTVAGSGLAGSVDATGASASFNWPWGVALDGAGNLYVVDTNNHKIRKVTPAGVVSTFAGSGTAGYADGTGANAAFNTPSGIVSDSAGNLYVVDSFNQRIRKITPAGVVSTLAGSGTPGSADGTGTAASFSGPAELAIDTAGNLYVADGGNGAVRKITPAGAVTTLATGLSLPYGVAVDAAGVVYVSDWNTHNIYKVQ